MTQMCTTLVTIRRKCPPWFDRAHSGAFPELGRHNLLPPLTPAPSRSLGSLGRLKANGVRFYLFGSIFNLPDQVNIKKYHLPSRGHSFSSITSTLFDIEQ